jgi:putative colanic acid biosynthesis acetyltransferase WcaF
MTNPEKFQAMRREMRGDTDPSIAPLDLGNYKRPRIDGNRGFAWRAAWYLVNALFFQGTILGLLPSRVKAIMLRAFGAQVGSGLVCKPRVSIKYPWFLEVGDNVWLGEMVWIDNHCAVTIGSNVCISQGAYIFTGNHDFNDPAFTFFCKPIEIGDGVWVTAFQRIGPGTKIPPCTVLRTAGSS